MNGDIKLDELLLSKNVRVIEGILCEDEHFKIFEHEFP